MIGRTFQQSFGDKRLDERGNEIIRNLLVKGTHSVRQFSQNSAQQKGSYRFLENERTTEDAIIQSMSNRCAMAVKNRVVLVFRIPQKLICIIIKTVLSRMTQ